MPLWTDATEGRAAGLSDSRRVGCAARIVIQYAGRKVIWSSQDSVDTPPGPTMSHFELVWAHAFEVAVPT